MACVTGTAFELVEILEAGFTMFAVLGGILLLLLLWRNLR